MADTSYRGNLTAKMITTDWLTYGRSVVIRDRDNNYAPTIAAKTDEDKDMGIPQVLYIANVMPTDYGYQSVSYFGSKEICPGTPHMAFSVRSTTETATLIHTKEGYLYRLRKDTEPLDRPLFIYIGTYNGVISYATVMGTTYIYVAKVGCYKFNFGTKTLEAVTLTGLEPTSVLGVTATGGYMLAWSEDAIAWSSLFDPTDFTPSLDTGAGGGSVEGAKGALTVCVSNSYGVYIFTEANCVSAALSNNSRYPFNFREIVGSSGLADSQAVSYEGNQNSAYAFTSAGFQQISFNAAKTVWTDLHENGLNCTHVDETTVISKNATHGKDGKVRDSKIASVASRYICISLKSRDFDYYDQCWIYDMALDRWGRLERPHLEVFEDEEFKIGLLTEDKRYVWVEASFYSTPVQRDLDTSYILMGRYQWSRERFTTLQEIHLENLYPVNEFNVDGSLKYKDKYPTVFVMSSLDGKSGSFSPTYRDEETSISFARYLKLASSVNHSILVKGEFCLNSIILTFTPGAGR